MKNADPSKRLLRGENIFNLAVIDNIDFKEKTFGFGNIYDVTKMKPSDLKNMKSKILPDNSESSSRLVESSQGNVGSELQQRCKRVATTKEKQF